MFIRRKFSRRESLPSFLITSVINFALSHLAVFPISLVFFPSLSLATTTSLNLAFHSLIIPLFPSSFNSNHTLAFFPSLSSNDSSTFCFSFTHNLILSFSRPLISVVPILASLYTFFPLFFLSFFFLVNYFHNQLFVFFLNSRFLSLMLLSLSQDFLFLICFHLYFLSFPFFFFQTSFFFSFLQLIFRFLVLSFGPSLLLYFHRQVY